LSRTPVEPDAAAFPHARQALKVEGTFTLKNSGEVQRLCRHYLTSQPFDRTSPASLAQQVRGHWRVENSNHWRRDALWREDACRLKDPTSACALALLRTTLISLVKWNHRHNFQEVFEDVAGDLSLGLHWLNKRTFR
jgi:hypothetical protein